jgi:phosphoglycolate phosphatase
MSSNLASAVSQRRRYRLIVYDLDGTLFETLPDLWTAANLALAERGHRTMTLEEVRAAIGDGARVLIERLCPPGAAMSEIDLVLELFREQYLRVCRDHSTLCAGALEFVRGRATDNPGRFQAILTNKPQRPTDLLVEHSGLIPFVGRTLGGDTSLGRKPDPAGLRALMLWAGAKANQTLLIGDGPADLAVAQAAGVDSVRLDGGYGQSQELDAFPCSWRANSFTFLESLWPQIEPVSDHQLPRL